MVDLGHAWNYIATHYSSNYTTAMASAQSETVAILGVVDAVGPCELGPDGDTTYLYVVIRERNTEQHHFTALRAHEGVSQLVEREVPGLFVFWDTKDECRLLCVVCEDGRQAVDFAAMRRFAHTD
jgi:hypothetical protein